MTLLLIALGAALGAPLRYLADRFVQARHDIVFPWGTFAVNVAGSAILGFLLGGAHTQHVSPALVAAGGTGFCGALTTFSTFGYETVRLTEDGAVLYAALNVVGSVAAGLIAAAGGWLLATVVFRAVAF